MKEFFKKLCGTIGCFIPIAFYVGLIILGVVTGISDFPKSRDNEYEDLYIDGYSVGYDDGYSVGYDEGLSIGWDYGHDEGIYYDWADNVAEIGCYFEEDAVHYAKDHGGWHPEEAWMIIEAYQNSEPFYEDGSSPSEQDYLAAIDSLIDFNDYFYSARYTE